MCVFQASVNTIEVLAKIARRSKLIGMTEVCIFVGFDTLRGVRGGVVAIVWMGRFSILLCCKGTSKSANVFQIWGTLPKY